MAKAKEKAQEVEKEVKKTAKAKAPKAKAAAKAKPAVKKEAVKKETVKKEAVKKAPKAKEAPVKEAPAKEAPAKEAPAKEAGAKFLHSNVLNAKWFHMDGEKKARIDVPTKDGVDQWFVPKGWVKDSKEGKYLAVPTNHKQNDISVKRAGAEKGEIVKDAKVLINATNRIQVRPPKAKEEKAVEQER